MTTTCGAQLHTHRGIIECALPADHTSSYHENGDHIWVQHKGEWYWNRGMIGEASHKSLSESQEAYAERVRAALDASPSIL